MRPVSEKRRASQQGFMLLFVFLLAATAAIGLYIEMPRIAFESQRLREDLLVSRGNEYKRAIELYFRKNGKYPAKMEDLEGGQGVRYLRRKYIDPMTGKDEWRLIRVGPMGEFLDSVTIKKDDKKKSENTFITEFAGVGQTTTGQAGGVTVANRVRQSDMAGAPGQGVPGEQVQGSFEVTDTGRYRPPGEPAPPPPDPNAPPQGQPGEVPQGQYPQGQYPTGPYPPGQVPPGAQPGQYQPGQQGPFPGALQVMQQGGMQPTQPGQPGYYRPPGQPGQPPVGYPPNPQQGGYDPTGRYVPGVGSGDRVQPAPWAPSSSQTGGQVAQPFGQQGQSPYGQQQPGTLAQNPAVAKTIMDMITRPRQGGTMGPGANPQQGPGGVGMGAPIGPGIAGVASKFEAEGIKVINEKTKYNEWEFLYDARKAAMSKAGMSDNPMQNPNPLGPSNKQGSSGSGFGTGSSGFGGGNSSGFGTGSSSGFGNENRSGSGFGGTGRSR